MSGLIGAAVELVIKALPETTVTQWRETTAAASTDSCFQVWEHTVWCLDAYADQLAQGPDIHEWLPVEVSLEDDVDVSGMLRSALVKARQVDALVNAGGDWQGWHPWGGVTDASGFQSTSLAEVLVHGWDVLRGFNPGDDWLPPAELAAVPLSRIFPDVPPHDAADAGRMLLHVTGRVTFPGLEPVAEDWKWDVSPLASRT